MSAKRRILKILLVASLVLVFTGYFAFSTFLFQPFEGDYELDVSTLVPRNVDFFLAKAGLERDFGDFPELAVADALEASRGGSQLLASPEYASWRAELGIDEALAGLAQLESRAPVEIDPLELLGGRELAVAGYFRGPDLATTDWAVYARGNWMAKLALALLRRPGLIGLESQGITAVVEDESVTLSGGELPRALHLARVQDVFVISTDPALTAAARELDAAQAQDSFGVGSRYHDQILIEDRDDDELEVYVDYRALAEAFQLSGRWPDGSSEAFFPSFMAKLFQLGAVREAAGVLDMEGGLQLDLNLQLSSELVTAEQKRLYRTRGFDQDRVLRDVARMVPQNSGLLLYLHGNVGELLRMALASSERALQDNLDDLVRGVWEYPDTGPLIDDLDAAFHGRAAFVMRPNDYPVRADDPPNDGEPVLAWALILWIDSLEQVIGVRQRVMNNPSYFALEGRDGDSGVYSNVVGGGVDIYEFWSLLVPGTGHIAVLTDEGQGVCVITNNHKMLTHLSQTSISDGSSAAPEPYRDVRPLSSRGEFTALLNSGLASSNLLLWLDPSRLTGSLREQALRWAQQEVVIDWTVMRPQIDRRVLAENFPDWRYESLTPEQSQQLEALAAPERAAFEAEFRGQQVPAIQAEYERSFVYAEMVSVALLELGLDAKEIDLCARVLVPLEPPQ